MAALAAVDGKACLAVVAGMGDIVGYSLLTMALGGRGTLGRGGILALQSAGEFLVLLSWLADAFCGNPVVPSD